MKGTLPNELGQLTLLKTLSLKDNRLSGRIPETVGVQGLDVLTVLDVSGNILSGTLPKTFSQNLSELHLNDNLLTGEVPSSIGELVNIQYLGLYNNSLSGKLLEQPFLYKMTGLSSLELGDNLFSGTISTDIVMLTKLKTLNLGHQVSLKSTHSTAEEQARRFIGTIPTELGRLSNLEWVNLSGNRLTGSIPTEIAELPLHTLALNHNELTGTFPVELASLSNIGRKGCVRSCVIEMYQNLTMTMFVKSQLPFRYKGIPSLEVWSHFVHSLLVGTRITLVTALRTL